MKKESFSRVFPFALFMLFIGLEEFARYLQGKAILQVDTHDIYWIYPVKAVAVGAVLILFRKHYREIRLSDLGKPAFTAASLLVGLGVFWLWVNMDWNFGTQGTPSGFNPNVFDDPSRTGMTAMRLAGAVLVVPVRNTRPVRNISSGCFALDPPGVFGGFGDLCAADGGVAVLVKSKKPKADGKCSDGSAEATLPSLFRAKGLVGQYCFTIIPSGTSCPIRPDRADQRPEAAWWMVQGRGRSLLWLQQSRNWYLR